MQLFNEQIIQALCWTLIHSLWQGLLLAVLGGVVIMLTKKSSSVARYNALAVLFFLFVSTATFTFAWTYNNLSIKDSAETVNLPQSDYINNTNLTAAAPLSHIQIEKSYAEIFTNYFNEHASLIVMIWFIILSLQFIRLLANTGYAIRVKSYRTFAPSIFWEERMYFLAYKLQIKRRVQLLQSEIVKAPIMVGFLKPVILFPFSLMSQLPPEQVEAVLLHELAHIKRKDYFVNILQSFAEMIFFFNPGVLWISSLIKDERENCCDDIAINETKQRKEFINALLSFQEYNLSATKYAMAFPGNKNHLLNRAKRILTNQNKTLNNMEKISLAAGIIVIGLTTFAFKQTIQDNKPKLTQAFAAPSKKNNMNDTIPGNDEKNKPESNYTISDNGKEYRIKEADGKVIELFVDGKRIPDDEIKDYQEIIDGFRAKMKQQHDELEVQKLAMEKQKEALAEQQARMNKEQAEINDLREKENREKILMQLKAQQEEMDAKAETLERYDEIMELQKRGKSESGFDQSLKKKSEELMLQNENLKERQNKIMEYEKLLQQKGHREQAELLNRQLLDLKNEQLRIQQQELTINSMLLNSNQYNILKNPSPDIQNQKLLQEKLLTDNEYLSKLKSENVFQSWPLTNIINELADEGIIADRENFDLELNNKILKVNGKLQSEELHERFKKTYLKSEKSHVKFSRHGNSMSGDINNE